jgi:hypothetical protein
MDKSKAKKAVKKSESRKQSSKADKAQQLALAAQAAGIAPEIQSPSVDLQPADGYVNPYRALGAMAPTTYNPGNMVNGYNFPVMVNPET